jgi:hypothetical protein
MKLWRGQPDNWKWKPSARETARLLIGFGALFYLLALIAFVEPSGPPSGRRLIAQLRRVAYDALGASGDAIVYAAIGTIFLVGGLLKYRSNEQTGL